MDCGNHSIERVISAREQREQPTYSHHQKKMGKNQNDTIINMFGDILLSSKYEGDSKVSNNFSGSLSPIRKEDELLLTNKFTDNFCNVVQKQEKNGANL